MGWSVLLVSLLCVACARPSEGSGEKQITVSIEPLRYVTERLVGDLYTVHTLVPRGASPETYEPTPRQMMELSGSEFYVACGALGFEQAWLDKLRLNAPETTFICAAEGIPLLASEHRHSADGHGDCEAGDPHVWTSPRNMASMARTLCDTLCKRGMASAPVYRENLASFLEDIRRVDERITAMLAGTKARAFLIYHPALTYFAHDYGLEQLTLEEDGKEPSAARLRTLVDRCRAAGVRTVFVQKEFDMRHAEIVAKEIGARAVPVDPLAYDWEKEMLHIAEELKDE